MVRWSLLSLHAACTFCSTLYSPLDVLASAHVASFEVALAELFALVMHPGLEACTRWRRASQPIGGLLDFQADEGGGLRLLSH